MVKRFINLYVKLGIINSAWRAISSGTGVTKKYEGQTVLQRWEEEHEPAVGQVMRSMMDAAGACQDVSDEEQHLITEKVLDSDMVILMQPEVNTDFLKDHPNVLDWTDLLDPRYEGWEAMCETRDEIQCRILYEVDWDALPNGQSVPRRIGRAALQPQVGGDWVELPSGLSVPRNIGRIEQPE
jgi:hypothetical protein